MSNANSCIRVYADEKQINACKDELNQVQNSIARLAKVLNLAGNEVRLKIMYLLHIEGEMCPCDLSDVLGMTVPAISQHLRKMKDGGLVKDNKVGQTVFYSLQDENLKVLNPLFDQINMKAELVNN